MIRFVLWVALALARRLLGLAILLTVLALFGRGARARRAMRAIGLVRRLVRF